MPTGRAHAWLGQPQRVRRPRSDVRGESVAGGRASTATSVSWHHRHRHAPAARMLGKRWAAAYWIRTAGCISKTHALDALVFGRLPMPHADSGLATHVSEGALGEEARHLRHGDGLGPFAPEERLDGVDEVREATFADPGGLPGYDSLAQCPSRTRFEAPPPFVGIVAGDAQGLLVDEAGLEG